MSRTDELLKNARAYAESFDNGDLPMPPGLGVAVVACMDARVNIEPGRLSRPQVRRVADDQKSVIESNRPAARKSPVTPDPTGVRDDVAVFFDSHPRHANFR